MKRPEKLKLLKMNYMEILEPKNYMEILEPKEEDLKFKYMTLE